MCTIQYRQEPGAALRRLRGVSADTSSRVRAQERTCHTSLDDTQLAGTRTAKQEIHERKAVGGLSLYCLARITPGGFIRLVDSGETVHRESLFPDSFAFSSIAYYATLDEAKAVLPDPDPSIDPQFILAVKKGKGVQAIWCYLGTENAEIRKRLRTWSGCYGAWPIRKLNPKESLAA